MLATASHALNSVSDEVVSGKVADGLESGSTAPSASEAAAATVPTTKARRESRSGFDMNFPRLIRLPRQTLAHDWWFAQAAWLMLRCGPGSATVPHRPSAYFEGRMKRP